LLALAVSRCVSERPYRRPRKLEPLMSDERAGYPTYKLRSSAALTVSAMVRWASKHGPSSREKRRAGEHKGSEEMQTRVRKPCLVPVRLCSFTCSFQAGTTVPWLTSIPRHASTCIHLNPEY
jgi:hypothetical protein